MKDTVPNKLVEIFSESRSEQADGFEDTTLADGRIKLPVSDRVWRGWNLMTAQESV